MADEIRSRSFGRVGNLLKIFGFGALAPYDSKGLKRDGELGGGPNQANAGENTKDWYNNKVKDGVSFSEQLHEWDEMTKYSPIAAGIRIIVEECVQTEQSCPATLWVDGGDSETEKDLNELILGPLMMEDYIRSQFKAIVAYGNDFERLHVGPEGVHGWHFREIEKIERYSDESKRLIGFHDADEAVPDDLECTLWGNEKDEKRLWKPWDFIHMRLLDDNRNTEYGASLLKPAVQTYKKLRMAEDQMLIYRMQMQPTRYLVKIDVGDASVPEMWRLVNQYTNRMRSNRLLDQRSGQFESRNSPWSIDDMIFLPTRKDSTTDIRKLEGDSEIPDITDVQYLLRQLGSMMNIPPEYLGASPEANQGLSPKSPLALQDLRLQRSIKTVRAAVMQGYDKVCRIHLCLLNKDPFIPFRIRMSNITALEAESQLELVSAQADLADKIIQLGTNIKAPAEEWYRMVFTKFFPLPKELVDIVAIGSISPSEIGADQGDQGAPLPGGPSLDLGGAIGGDEENAMDQPLGGPGAAPGAEAEPDAPGAMPGPPPAPMEAFDSDAQVRRRALYEWRRQSSAWHKRYFSLDESTKRYARQSRMPLTEARKELIEVRKQLDEFAEKSLPKHSKKLKVEIGNILHILDGYRPDYAFIEQNLKLLKIAKKDGLLTEQKEFLPQGRRYGVTEKENRIKPANKLIKVVQEMRKIRNGDRPLLS